MRTCLMVLAAVAAMACGNHGLSAQAETSPAPEARKADGGGRVPFYGLYAWCSDLREREIALIKEVGLGLVGTIVGKEHEKGMLLCAGSGIHLAGFLEPNRYGAKMNLEGWRQHVREALERYAPGGTFWKENADVPAMPIVYWCLVSEPGTELKPPGDVMPDEAYFKLLEVAHEVIKGHNKDLKIVAMSPIGAFSTALSPNTVNREAKTMGPYAFIQGVHKLGGARYYDCIDIHPFTFPMPADTGGVAAMLAWLKDETKKQGAEKPVWMTEMGFPMAYGPRNPFHLTKDQAADYMVRYLVLCARHNVEAVTLTYVNDQISSRTGWYKAYGFFKNGRMRPMAKATKLLIDLIPDRPQLLEIISDGQNVAPPPVKSSDRPYADSPFYCYKFKGRNDSEVFVVWTEGRPFKYDLKVPRDKMALYNRELLGGVVYSREQEAGSISDKGEMRIPVSTVPLFITTEVTPELEKQTMYYLKPPHYREWKPIPGTED